jgi:hypothetical protein
MAVNLNRGALAQPNNLGIVSLFFGLLGLAFCWWVPLGIVLSLAGLIIGIVSWVMASTRMVRSGLIVGGTILSLAVLVLDLVLAFEGIGVIWFSALR